MNTGLWNMGPRFRGDDGRVNGRAYSVIAFLIASLSAGVSHAQSTADFYSRTTVRLIISADPGGSYDHIGRLISRHLGRHIPGHPRVVPENMLGASGRVAANYLYHAAPKDGSVIGLIQQSIPMGQALGEGGVQYDAARFNWIGSPVRLDETLVVWHTTGVRTIEDAKKKTVIIGATSPTGMNYVYPKLANELLGRPFVTSPTVPPERAAALREAFRKTMADPDFLVDAARSQIEIHPILADELETLVRRVLSAPKSAIDLLKAALTAQ